jgi:hypothetical protein
MHFNTKDLTGMTFGKLKVENYSHSVKYNGHSKAVWNCKCECGNSAQVFTCHLTSGHTQTCGCSHIEAAHKLNYKHGMSKTRFYEIWLNIHKRCYEPNNQAYPNYGGRGITVCKEWHEFENFYRDMYSTYTNKATIDRIDNNSSYSKDNCKWSNRTEQSNNRRSNRVIEFEGELETLAEWCRIKNLHYKAVHRRLKIGWSIEQALTTPIK